MMRVGVNIVVIGILGGIAYIVYYASDIAFQPILSKENTQKSLAETANNFFIGLAPSLTISIGNIIGPNILELVHNNSLPHPYFPSAGSG